jgi:acyl-CoA thioesterase I
MRRFFLSELISAIAYIILLASCNEKKEAPAGKETETVIKDPISVDTMKTILCYGNSLTAGYGVDLNEAYPALLQKRIDSLGLKYKVINAGLSGETSAAGINRLDWVLKQPVEIFILELGANDGLRGISVKLTRQNLQTIIDKVKKISPQAKIVLAGMRIPPSMGDAYAKDFEKIFPDLAAKNDIALIPFLLNGVGGEAKYNQGDGVHPTAEGYKLVMENVWVVLKKIL